MCSPSGNVLAKNGHHSCEASLVPAALGAPHLARAAPGWGDEAAHAPAVPAGLLLLLWALELLRDLLRVLQWPGKLSKAVAMPPSRGRHRGVQRA
jgi:hypothetical protein